MTIWIFFAGMTGLAVMAVLWPLSRASRMAVPSSDLADRTFYRDQIAEIDRDLARGLLSEAEAQAARAEAARRLIRASGEARGFSDSVDEPALRRRRAASALALSTVPLLALAMYGAYGSPGLPDQPLHARMQGMRDPAQVNIVEAVARIEAHLARQPDDARGWEVLAPVYMRQGRFGEAASAYLTAMRLVGETPERLTSFGEALVNNQDGVVSADARAAFERALEKDAQNPKARFFLARAAEQDGNADAAKSHYETILAHSPADAPWVPLVNARVAALNGGASPADAIASLPAVDRAEAIRGMVSNLAHRLSTNGGSAEEWGRLVRSYLVLGEREQALDALGDARRALAPDGASLSQLDALERQIGGEGGRQ